MYQPRTYRTLMERGERPFFRVMVQETDLYVHARKPLESVTRDLVLQYRAQLETYLRSHPEFGRSLRPVSVRGPAPSIVREMAEAGSLAGVGPMAAVAGTIASSLAITDNPEIQDIIRDTLGEDFGNQVIERAGQVADGVRDLVDRIRNFGNDIGNSIG